jgi:RHS repeat-associated protein
MSHRLGLVRRGISSLQRQSSLLILASLALIAAACGHAEPEGAASGASRSSGPAGPLGTAREALVSSTAISVTGDTYLQSGTPNQNLGGDTRLSLQSLGRHRTLLFFEPSALVAAVGTGSLISARIELTLATPASNWGASARTIAIHRLKQESAEYQATWNCALDANVNNRQNDCSGASSWAMAATSPAQQPWLSPPTATAPITSGQTGAVSFDVTLDVAAILAGNYAGYGWLIKKVDENAAGSLEFVSREQGPGPRLLLEVDGGPGSGGGPGPVTGSATVTASADTHVRQGEPNQNFGSSNELRIRAAGRNRALLAFDAVAVSGALAGPLVRARLKLPIAEAADNWGSARALGAHRLRRSWTELGATWNCALDSNTANSAPDCGASSSWTMFGAGTDVPWLDPPTGTTLVSSGQAGTLELDVTRDVACALAGFVPLNGWIIKKELENQSGRIDLHSREAATPPALFLEWTNGSGVVVTATECNAQTPPPDGCTPTAPTDTTCNGLDDDCDGQADDDFTITPSTCGVGACASTGAVSCVAGQLVDSCIAGSPAENDAVCNIIDDDCDGITDEDYVGVPTLCGVGACRAPGLTECVLGQELDNCRPGNPAPSDATCDGNDDDCDGTPDENFPPAGTSCGVGACAATGQTSCVGGQIVDGCAPAQPAANDGTCNGVDDDCDGSTDEEYLPVATSCGVGRCSATGATHCAAGLVSDDCTPGAPASSDSSCDGVDDDCDGVLDEDFVRSCSGNALSSCVAGTLQQQDCSDANPCNGQETCASATCLAGSAPELDDQNPCTTDSCAPGSGVRHDPAPGQVCPLDACRSGVCDAEGACQLAAGLVDDDGDPCTVVLCDPATGQREVTCEPVDESRVTTVFDSTSWIYSGATPIQTGVAPGTIERRRVALLHGEARDRSGAPLSGVQVSVADHPELGSTQSQLDGRYDFVINAGGQVTLDFRAPGRLSAQRSLEVAWNEIARVPPVVLIESDPVATAIDLSQTATPFQVAMGSLQEDADGERQATLLFPAGTAAMMLRADGTSVPIDSMHVRATEFTVGESGPDAMPGPLPPTSAYTYAVEFNADEAVASGAVSIEFSVPLIGYVDNFLDFPAGTVVPVGAYDGRSHRWVPHQSGVVLDVVSISAAGADLDATGDGIADSAAALQALGISPEERVQLAALKEPGDSIWRIKVPHFSQPYDCNWPFGPPAGAAPPPGPDDDGPGDPGDGPDDGDQPAGDDTSGPESDDPCRRSGSIIECQNMTLRESLPVAGTPYSLEYASNRAAGRRDANQVPIRLSTAEVAASLRRIAVEIDIAGQHHFQEFAPAPNQFHLFEWDGRDSYGRRLKGQQTARVRLTYAYEGSYQTAGSFGDYPSGVIIAGSRARQEIFLTRQWQVQLGAWEPPGLGGWTLDMHHAYDVASGAIYLGDGRRRLAAQLSTTLNRAASPPTGSSTLGHLHAVGPDGSMYLIIDIGWAFRRSPDGVLTQLTPSNMQFSDLALAPDGSLYLIQAGQHRVYRREPNGTLSVIAGTGVAGFSGDGGPATAARLNDPRGIAVDGSGAIYIADSFNRRVRRVGTDGVMRTVAGNGSGLSSGEVDGVLATQSAVFFPTTVAVTPDGTLYIGDNVNHRLYEVSTNGIINRIIATANPVSQGLVYQDGVASRQARVYAPNSIAVTPTGQVLFVGFLYWQGTSREEAVFALSPDKRIYRVVGGARLDGVIQSYYQGAPPRGISLSGSNFANPNIEIAHGPDGLYVGLGSAVDRLAVPPPKLSSILASDLLVPAEEDGEILVFDATGRHKATRHSGTGAILREFFYDASGLLSEVRDSDGNRTLIERNANGDPAAIQAPYGQRTLLELDANGYLSRIEDPLGAETLLANSPEGLLESLTDARGAETTMEYDVLGRLKLQHQPNGGLQQLVAFGNTSRWQLDFVSAEGRSTRYRVDQTAKGEVYTSTFADGTTANTSYDTNAARWVTTANDGTVSTVRETSDLRFGLARPLRETVLRLPSGLSYTVQTTRTTNGSTATNPFDYLSEVTNIAVNGNTWGETYVPSSRTRTLTSPESRQVTIREDATGRVTQQTTAGQQPVVYAYDARGRLETITQGARVTRLTYEDAGSSNGYLESVINALGQTTLFSRDARGRAVIEQYPDGANSQFGWDANDNFLSLLPPERPEHVQTYSLMDELETSVPPIVPGMSDSSSSYQYNLEGQVTSETRPDGSVVTMSYDSAGRPESISLPTGLVTYAYYPSTSCSGCAPGQLMLLSGPSDVAVATEYNGRLITANTWSGDVNGSLRWTHDSNFRISTETVDGVGTDVSLTFGYDRDGLQTCASPTTCTTPGADALRYTYNGAGQALTTRLGNLNLNYTYNAFGEVASATATYNGGPLFAASYDTASLPRDGLGRIRTKTETIAGVATSWGYEYDLRGRLIRVNKDGILASEYSYDDNGNRLSETTAAGTVTSAHDDQDRLLTRGALSFSYRPSGELESTLDAGSGALTTYSYDALGNLLSVVLPDARVITYVADGRGRRVGRAVDGVLLQGLLYRDQLRVAAEVDGAGQVVSQFVYTGVDHSPDAMRRGGQIFRFIKDQLGSVRMVVNVATGEVVQALNYDAFGVVLQDTNPGFQPFGFAGGLYDPDTGLVRFGARDYSALAGRWTSKDPAGIGVSANLYAYVGNNPVSETDPTGECPWCVAAGVGAVSGAGFDLALQLLMNGGRLGCVDWGSVGTAALTGAALSGLGPSGFLIGRGGPKAAQFGYSRSRALLNRGTNRFGWSGPQNGKDVLSLRLGGKHYDVPGLGVPSGANPGRDGAWSGLFGGGLNRGASGSCGCGD